MASTPFPVGFGRYTLLRSVGRPSAMVFLATHGTGEAARLCVVRRAGGGGTSGPGDLATRFNEATRPLLRLSHPNIARVFDAGQVAGELFVAVELSPGRDLRTIGQRLAEKGRELTAPLALFLAHEMCRGLAHAHAHRITHRNLSPNNVVVSWMGDVKLIDFALPSAAPPVDGPWLAPEQRGGGEGDPRSDLWAVGVLLWELLTGRPIPGARGEAPLDPPSRFVPALTPSLDGTVMRALATSPADRWPGAERMREAIGRELATIQPATDGASLTALLAELWGEEIARERADHELLLREAKLRVGDGAASPSPAAGSSVALDTTGVSTTAALMQRGSRPSPIELIDDLDVEPDAEQYIGQLIGGRYRVDRILGQGGMGWVYEVEHIEIGKRLALKILLPRFSRQNHLVQRFRREARAASTIGHPNIVDVTDSGTTADGNFYFVMEKLLGVELGMAIYSERKFAPERAVHIAVQMCRGLAAAHAHGIIHRDLKPENIYLISRDGDADFVKVLDFGIAKSPGETNPRPGAVMTGAAMGTPEYMAPEQAEGRAIDPRIDVYSVGAILYEMVVGSPPHTGATSAEVLAKKSNEKPRPVRSHNPSVSEALERVIHAALEIDPERRPLSMSAFEYELTKCMKGRGSAVAAVLGIKSAERDGWASSMKTPSSPSIPYPDNQVENNSSIGSTAPMPQPVALPESAASATPITLEQALPPSLAPAPAPAQGAEPPPSASAFVVGLASRERAADRPSWGLIAVGCVALVVLVVGFAARRLRFESPVVATAPTLARPSVETVSAPVPTAAMAPKHEPVEALLDWARRSLDAQRLVAPPGDNLKELLERIEAAEPGNVTAAGLRSRATGGLRARAAEATTRGDLDDLIASLRALAELDPFDTTVGSRIAIALADRSEKRIKKRQLDEALSDARAAVELSPDDPRVRTALADAELAAGHRQGAVEVHRRVLAASPADAAKLDSPAKPPKRDP